MTNKMIKLGLLFCVAMVTYACNRAAIIDDNEKEWLKNHPNLSIGISPNQPPYQFIDKNAKISGMFIDFLTILEDRLDYKFKKIYEADWPKLLADAKAGKVDVILQIQETDERNEYLNFTPALISHKHVIVVKNNRNDIATVTDLIDKRIAVINSFAIHNYLSKNYPNYTIIPVFDNVSGLRAVSTGQVDAFITQQSVVTYYIDNEGISNLKIAGEVDYPNELAFACRKDLDTLNIILSKAVNSITKTDKLNIYNNWLSHEVKPFYAEAKFWIINLLIILGVLTFVILFNLVLRKRVIQKTKELRASKEKVEESEKRYRSLMHNLETGIVVYAPDTSIIMNNAKASELLGLNNDQKQGKVAIDPSWKFIAGDNMPLPLEEFPVNRILKLMKPISNQVLGIEHSSSKDVVWVLVNGFPALNDKGEIIEIVISFFNITERKQSEQIVLDSKVKLSQLLVESNQSRQLLLSVLEDQVKAKETLRESNEYLESLFNFTTAPIVVWDRSLIITRFNRAFEQLSGFDAAEVIGKQVSILFPEDKIESWLSLVKKTIEGEQWDAVEIDILRKDKEKKIVVWNSSNIVDKGGETIVATIAFGYDITERKKIEQALQESQDRLELFFSQSIDGFFFMMLDEPIQWDSTVDNEDVLDYVFAHQHITKLNDAMLHQYLATEEQLINLTPNDLFTHNIEAGRKVWSELFDFGQYHVDTEEKRFDGSDMIIEGDYICLYDSQHRITGHFGVQRDVTNYRMAEKRLHESERKLSTLFASMTEMVVIHELVLNETGEAIDYRIIDCNDTFTQITGIEKENAKGKLATEIYQTNQAPYLEEYTRVCITGQSMEYKTYYSPMDKHFLISAVSMGLNLFATITTDITAIEKTHEVISEKNKELENYIYVTSHDLRSPLVNIQGFSQRLEKQTNELKKIVHENIIDAKIKLDLDKITLEDMPKSLNFILSNVLKMDTLINGLLQLSRTGRILMTIKKIDANKLFKSIVSAHNYELTENEAKVHIHDLDDCYGDENQLNQLFSNIINNAIKYRDKSRSFEIEIASQTHYKRVVYSIKDSGIGINARHLEKIWDVFYRVDSSSPEAGEGIGLSLARRIADKHEGKIWVESEEGKGSTFYVELHRNEFGE